MDVVLLVGRILFGLIFLLSAVGHLTKTQYMAGYAASKGVPAAAASVVLSGILMLLGGLSVVLGVWGDLGALILAIVLVPTTLLFHNFWTLSDPQAKATEQISFNKNLALIGGALVLIVVFVQNPALSLTGPLF